MPKEKYGATARVLHWAIAGMIVTQYILAKLAERADDANQLLRQLGLLANHKSVGITILALAVFRLAWRLVRRPPALPRSMPGWQTTASHISHWSLYALLLAMPVTGWLMSSASAYSVSWFNLLVLPDLVGPDPGLKDVFEEIHETLAKVLLAVAALHILAALKHAVIDRDGVMSRMTGIPTLILFAAVVVAGATTLSSPGKKAIHDSAAPPPLVQSTQDQTTEPAPAQSPATDTPTTEDGAVAPAADPLSGDAASEDGGAPPIMVETTETAAAVEKTTAPLPLWKIDYAASFIRFTGDQAGASFDGEWTAWQAQIRFAGDALSASSFDVTIDTTQVTTRDAERDGVLGDPEWFDSSAYPQAYYRANDFRANADASYVADGELVIKGNAAPVPLTFTVTGAGNERVLEAASTSRLLLGQALLDRLALGVGTGEWEDTEWVGQEVRVTVRVEARLDQP